MSTKNLARTVIEGGRSHRNRWDRRHSNSRERSWERDLSARLLIAKELDDVVYRSRPKVGAWFFDKLGPAERWLAQQVGKPWSKVRSEIMQRFDTRSTAGRHIVFDHLLPSVEVEHRRFGAPPDFSVDRVGILRRVKQPRYFRRL